MVQRHKDLTGKIFGRWSVVKRDGRDKHRRALWLCKCECGSTKKLATNVLIVGDSKSCGCLYQDVIVKHRMTGSLEYISWAAMKSRCTNIKNSRYKSHGARGVKVCSRWDDFETFLADMGKRPSKDYSIERIDNDGNYEPSNCRWATAKEQARNRRSTFYVTIKGEEKSLAEWAEIYNAKYKLAWKRIKYLGWPPEKALIES